MVNARRRPGSEPDAARPTTPDPQVLLTGIHTELDVPSQTVPSTHTD
jgi:hypothetical protein